MTSLKNLIVHFFSYNLQLINIVSFYLTYMNRNLDRIKPYLFGLIWFVLRGNMIYWFLKLGNKNDFLGDFFGMNGSKHPSGARLRTIWCSNCSVKLSIERRPFMSMVNVPLSKYFDNFLLFSSFKLKQMLISANLFLRLTIGLVYTSRFSIHSSKILYYSTYVVILKTVWVEDVSASFQQYFYENHGKF